MPPFWIGISFFQTKQARRFFLWLSDLPRLSGCSMKLENSSPPRNV